MNATKFTQALEHYRKCTKANIDASKEELNERKTIVETYQSFTQEKVSALTPDLLYEMIAPLWAMRMWGNKHYSVDLFVKNNGLDKLRKQLTNLLYGKESIDKRWDDFRTNIRDIGPAIMSELLCRIAPDKYILWNKKAQIAFQNLGIENVPNNNAGLDGKTYAYLCETGRNLVQEAQKEGYIEVDDLLSLNFFMWQELQEIVEKNNKKANPHEPIQQIETKETKKIKTFVHNDVRDRIRDIGDMLGFTASVEKKVADGAVVDAVWEARIGNMGRVIYVFEVQTSGSIDSLILNLMKSKSNAAVQGIVAVSDAAQLEKIRREVASLKDIKDSIKYWDYNDVLNTYDSLTSAFESINNLGLVPEGL
jgi:hypothetical protein